jgi:hypothetical protein
MSATALAGIIDGEKNSIAVISAVLMILRNFIVAPLPRAMAACTN